MLNLKGVFNLLRIPSVLLDILESADSGFVKRTVHHPDMDMCSTY